MKRHRLAGMFLVVGAASPALGQYTLKTLATFSGGTNGAGPSSPLLLSGTNLYGTTQYGGSAGGNGTLFSEPVTGGAPTILASFNGTNGYAPSTTLIVSGSALIGTANLGGPGYTSGPTGDGTVFSVPISGGTPTVLAAFNGTDGEMPYPGGVLLSGSTLYGSTSEGGVSGDGVVFSLPVTGGTPTVLTSFNGTDGNGPGNLILSGSTLYGTTGLGGTNGDGTVFALPITGGTPTVLASFNGTNGQAPLDALVLSGSTLYGITGEGGANNLGAVFSLPISGGTPTVLASFDNTHGEYPYYGGVILSGNTLFGTTADGGASGDGIVFSLPVTGGTPTDLISFNGTNGSTPEGGVAMDASGDLFGDTFAGGADTDGTVFELAVPEPTSIGLVAISSLALLRRSRRPFWRACAD